MKTPAYKIGTALIMALCIILPAQGAVAALKPGDKAPEVLLPDRDGEKHSLVEIARAGGAKGVIVNFFATWCSPCMHELPVLNSASDELKKRGIRIVLVDVKEDFSDIDAGLKELHIGKLLVLSDRYGKAAEAFEVRFLPTTFFIGADGRIKDIVFGGLFDTSELMTSAGKIAR